MKNVVATLLNVVVFAIIYVIAAVVVGALVRVDDDLSFMIANISVVTFVYLLVTLFERVRYKSAAPIARAVSGFNAMAVLWGVLFMSAVSVVASPLDTLLPDDRHLLPEGGWTMLTAVVIAPIFEELIFRGRLYSLLRHSAKPSVAVLLSALVFAMAHGSVIVGISAFLSGIIFGYFYLLKRSVIAPIILHICNNAIAYALIVLSYQGKSLQELIGTSNGYFILYAVSLVVSVLGFSHLIRTLYKADRDAKA